MSYYLCSLQTLLIKIRSLFLYPFTSGILRNTYGASKLKFILFWMSKALFLSEKLQPTILLKFKQAKFIFSCGIEIATFEDIFIKKVYERVSGFLVRENNVIVDVGANVGFYSVYAALMNPAAKIYAIEPVPKTRQRLEKNIQLNGVTNIEVIPLALWESDCELYFEPHKYSPLSRANLKAKGIRVAAITLDTFVLRYNIGAVDLMKIDAEFAEDFIIKGGGTIAFSKISKIVLEYHSEEKKFVVKQLLKSYGFEEALHFNTLLYFVKEFHSGISEHA